MDMIQDICKVGTIGETGMSDLIERQDAIDAMANTLWHYPNECYRNLNEYEFAKGLAELGLKSVPSSQPEDICSECDAWNVYKNYAQPEIIRCKDCKFNVSRNHKCLQPDSFFLVTEDDFYCGYAERRTDGV